jgi:hypothetical protein
MKDECNARHNNNIETVLYRGINLITLLNPVSHRDRQTPPHILNLITEVDIFRSPLDDRVEIDVKMAA